MRWGKLTEEVKTEEKVSRLQRIEQFQYEQVRVKEEVELFEQSKARQPRRFHSRRYALLPTQLTSGRWVWLGEYEVERCASVEEGMRWFGDPDLGWLYKYVRYWEKKT